MPAAPPPNPAKKGTQAAKPDAAQQAPASLVAAVELTDAPPRPAGKQADEREPKAQVAQKRVSVSSILSSVSVSEEERRDHRIALAKALAECVAVFAVYLGLILALRLPAPERPLPVSEGDGIHPQFVWLQMRAKCWSQPLWPELLKLAQRDNPNVKVALVGEGNDVRLRVDNAVDQPTVDALTKWAGSQYGTCLYVEKIKDDKVKEEYAYWVKGHWSTTSKDNITAAAAKLKDAHARVASSTWDGVPTFLLESTEFPAASMVPRDVRKAFAAAGIKDFEVEPIGPNSVEAVAVQRWNKTAIEPFRKAQRGANVLQLLIYLGLTVVWLVILRGRFASQEDDEPPTTARQGALRGLLAATVAAAAVFAVARVAGMVSPTIADTAREKDKIGAVLSLLCYGVALPALAGLVCYGYMLRRLTQATETRYAGFVAALLVPMAVFPIAPPLSPPQFLLLPMAAVGALLWHQTGRLGPAVAVVTASGAALAAVALF